jgi:hypothetical protein
MVRDPVGEGAAAVSCQTRRAGALPAIGAAALQDGNPSMTERQSAHDIIVL